MIKKRDHDGRLKLKDFESYRIYSPFVASFMPLSVRMPLKIGKRRLRPPYSPAPSLYIGEIESS